MPPSRIRVGVAIGILMGVATVAGVGPAGAAVKGSAASSAETVSSESWGAAGATTSGSATTGSPFVLSWPALTIGVSTQYFKEVNTGTVALTGETYTLTNSGGTTAVTLTGCVGAAWNTTLGTCGGTQVTLGSTAGSTSPTAAIAVGSSLSVRAQANAVVSVGAFTTAVSVSVARSQTRAGTTTTS